MTFTKFLKSKLNRKGQAALEYFILFAVVASAVVYGFARLGPLDRIEATLQGRFFQEAVGAYGLNIENH